MSVMSMFILIIIYSINALVYHASGFPDQGKWVFTLSKGKSIAAVPKSLFKDSEIYVKITCGDVQAQSEISVGWVIRQSPCWEEYLGLDDDDHGIGISSSYYELPSQSRMSLEYRNASVSYVRAPEKTYKCSGVIIPDDSDAHHSSVQQSSQPEISQLVNNVGETKTVNVEQKTVDGKVKRDAESLLDTPSQTSEAKKPDAEVTNTVPIKKNLNHPELPTNHPIYKVPNDGMYLLVVNVTNGKQTRQPFNTSVYIEMQGKYGYLSAADWPLLPFYGAMCLVYVIYGLAWLIVSFCQWRDLLRIQFWIGGVILLGMLEKATFYAEYQSINSTGISVKGAVLLAELVSCGKRMLARMLVIIVSLGFGIVKPRLGPMLHRVVGIGALYFVLAGVESYLRVMHPKNDPSNQVLVASIPLAVLDSAICWWIFTSLVQTTRTLRLRRNLVKLSLYRHFTNTLIFAVLSSVVFMLYSIKMHRLTACLTDWKELWVDDAYWHLLFSVLLLVIMILWRPTNNNQRYAFTPLLDAPEDEEDEPFVNDAFEGVKQRGYRSNSPKPKGNSSVDEDLKWVEENIPSSLADTALPILDSDEEIMTTKFEMSKME